jgi:predicted Fe-Mo cluster-binding NifX family protein
MKVAISSKGIDLESQVDPRFGRSQYFIIVDPAIRAFEVVNNEAAALSSGAGILAAQIVLNAGADVVITGSLLSNTTNALEAADMKVYHGASGNARRAVIYVAKLLGGLKGCRVCLLHILSLPEEDFFPSPEAKETYHQN